jgi:diketogulonate reductase-like aldo/keto reductase
MTKKDFKEIAECIRKVKERADLDYIDTTLLHTFMLELCDILRTKNPRFDRDRFINACGF